jgi:predicted CXXCH cytochrome family protein
MSRRWWLAVVAAAGTLIAAGLVYLSRSGREKREPPPSVAATGVYAPAASCAGCHAAIWKTYRQTGMGRAFSRFDPSRTSADFTHRNRFYHAASERYYTMYLKDGAAFMRRHQVGPGGAETNVVVKRIDYIMGSGHKGQTFLHRNARGELIELPAAWYTANGGYWAMNPSYDRPDHPGFRRRIKYDCFFCHDAYPAIPAGKDSFYADGIYPEKLPEGIDCQRCHGPGADHVAAASRKLPVERIRATIVNPRRLARDAQMEICMQCHLQSTSQPLPHAIVRLDRGVFSFRAGQPLATYSFYFDHPAGTGQDDKFEIAHAAYRLRQSICFRESNMTCTTCHDPHDVRRGAAAVEQSSAACRSCHQKPSPPAHANVPECVSCHMPQRRTEDAVQIVMTDHRIVRRPSRSNLTAPLKERPVAYHGPVAPYYPAKAEPLYEALAQVRVGTNLEQGLPMLEKAVRQSPDCGAACSFELAEAYGKAGRLEDAIRAGEEAVRQAPDNPVFLRSAGSALSAHGDLARGAVLLEKALALDPGHPRTLHDLALNYARQGRGEEALALLHRAAESDPDSPEIHSALAGALHAKGDLSGAENEFREAIRARPDYGLAHGNLALLLLGQRKVEEANFQFRQAVRFEPGNAGLHYRYGVALAMQGRMVEATEQLEAAVRIDPRNPESQFMLGRILFDRGDRRRALEHLRKAAESPRAEIRAEAVEAIRAIENGR